VIYIFTQVLLTFYVEHIFLTPQTAAAEGSLLSLHTYNELKSEKNQKPKVNVSCYTEFSQDR
jgi:hypothetical protein